MALEEKLKSDRELGRYLQVGEDAVRSTKWKEYGPANQTREERDQGVFDLHVSCQSTEKTCPMGT